MSVTNDKNNYVLKKIWLLGLCTLVLLMISIGGITRLTRSGLSIVEWRPISGIIPPLTDQAWQTQFNLYKESPEYNQINSHFTIEDYKNIFLWEYSHRLLGRIIFLFVLIPGLILWRKKIVSARQVLLFSSLIAVQGLIGWLMVKTGLNTKPHVSPYMLAVHFFLALTSLVAFYYQFLKIKKSDPIGITPVQMYLIKFYGVLLSVQIFYGCLVSGFKAGYGYNNYPLMNGDFFPADGFFYNPLWLNFFENTATLQWVHRWLGILVLITLLGLLITLVKSSAWKKIKMPVLNLLGITTIQVILGILNIIYVVPLFLASLHQLCASFLVLAYFGLVFKVRRLES